MPFKKALVVAIDDYGGPPNDLPSCIADGNAFARMLQTSYNIRDIHTVFDEQATVPNVEKELDWLVGDVRPDDRVVFFYSGHGFTKLTNEVMEEFIVLRDQSGRPALWLDDRLIAKTQSLPPGALSVILDCCFSGGFVKMVVDPTSSEPTLELAQAKVYQPPPEEQAKAFDMGSRKPHEAQPIRVTAYRRFGCSPTTSPRAIAKVLSLDTAAVTMGAARAVAPKALADSTESPQPEINGLLVSACLETETASASTSKTGGLSAFTHCMLKAVSAGGTRRPAVDVFNATARHLKAMGFQQTPLILERARPGTLKHRSFLDMEVRKVAEDVGITSFVSGSSGTASDEEIEKFLPILAAVLPAVISAAPGIINAVRPRRKAFDFADPFGESEAEDPQKFLPFITAAVSAALPAVLQAVRGRRKALERGGEMDITGESGEEDIQKFLPLITSIVSATLPTVLSAIRGRRKDLDFGGEAEAVGDEEMQKILPILNRLLPSIVATTLPLLQRLRPRQKELDFGLEDVGVEGDEKIFRAVLRVLPRVVRAAPGILQALAPQKEFDLGGTGSSAEVDEKIFRALMRVLPQVVRAAPGIVQALAPQKEFDLSAATATTQEGDEKIFAAILRVLPQVLQAAPAVAQAIAGARR